MDAESLCSTRWEVERLTNLLRGVTGDGWENRGTLDPLEKTDGVLGLLRLGEPILPSRDGAIVDRRRTHEVLLVTESSSSLSVSMPAYKFDFPSSSSNNVLSSFTPRSPKEPRSGVGRIEFVAELDRFMALAWRGGVVIEDVNCLEA